MKAKISEFKTVFTNKKYLYSFALSIAILVAGLVANFYAGMYATESASSSVTDIILSNTRAYDLDGSIGLAIGLLGFFAPTLFGGFYQRGQKRPKEDVQPGDARIFGVNVPKNVLESPIAQVAQLGATIRRVSDSKLRKRDRNTQGLSEGAMAGALGLAEATPFFKESLEMAKLMNPAERDQWLAELAKSRIEPQLIQQIAEYLDKNDKGEKIKRKPRNPTETFEAGIPGLRQNVPIKQSH